MTDRIRGPAWVDWCDNCSRALTGESIRWRRRRLCLPCAKRAMRDDFRHASMMLGNVARREKEETARERKEYKAAKEREYRLRDKAREEVAQHKARDELEAKVRAHVIDMLETPPQACDTCGTVGCTRHPDAMDEEAQA